MKTLDTTTGMDPETKLQMQAACNRVASGVAISPEERKAAAARIDRRRKENAERLGIQNVAVGLVRQLRDSQ